MKKKYIILSITGILLLAAGVLIWQYRNTPADMVNTGTDTKNNININVMLQRSKDWNRFVTTPIVDESFLSRIDGSTATIPVTAEICRQFFNWDDSKINDDITHTTTHNAYLDLINKTDTDIIFATEPSKAELKLAEKQGVKLDAVPITKEGFVFIVNKNNPIDSLTVGQIRDIYSGKIESWDRLGVQLPVPTSTTNASGIHYDLSLSDTSRITSPIYPYQREANSGSQTAMEQLVMKGRKLKFGLHSTLITGMGELISAVGDYDNSIYSIGYSYYYYLNNLYQHDNVKVLKINGISPDDKNLIRGAYPFTTGYYTVIRSDEAQDSPARKLRDWLLTDEGQKLVEMCGYCKVRN